MAKIRANQMIRACCRLDRGQGCRRLVCSRDPIAIAPTGRMCSYSMGCLCLVSMLLGRYRSGRRRRSAVSYWTQPQVWSHQQPPPMTYTSAARLEEAKQMQMLSLVRVSNHSAIFSSWLTTSAGVSHISIWLRG